MRTLADVMRFSEIDPKIQCEMGRDSTGQYLDGLALSFLRCNFSRLFRLLFGQAKSILNFEFLRTIQLKTTLLHPLVKFVSNLKLLSSHVHHVPSKSKHFQFFIQQRSSIYSKYKLKVRKYAL